MKHYTRHAMKGLQIGTKVSSHLLSVSLIVEELGERNSSKKLQ